MPFLQRNSGQHVKSTKTTAPGLAVVATTLMGRFSVSCALISDHAFALKLKASEIA